MRWSRGATQGTVVVGGNGEGEGANQFKGPTGLSFDRQGNLYVADMVNNRVQRFSIEKNWIKSIFLARLIADIIGYLRARPENRFSVGGRGGL